MAKILEEHAGYLSDRIKLERFQAAISKVVQIGDRVIDLGCGSGILGLLALRAGASKVLFVEEGEVIEIARRTIADAGYSDQSEFHRVNSYELTIAEPVDVIVCDHVGYFGFDYGLLGLLADAKNRFLKSGGILIPTALEPQLSLIESAECRKGIALWRDGTVPADFQWMDEFAANTKHAKDLGSDNLLASVATLGRLDLGEDADPFLTWKADFKCQRDGELDGVAGSFSCQLHDDTYITNSPGAKDSLNRPQAFLPLLEPVAITRGESIVVDVLVRHLDHIIGWIVELPEQNKKFAHTTFNGKLLDREMLTRAQPDRIVTLNNRGQARQVVLSYCDGIRTVDEIQTLMQRDHVNLFPTEQALSTFVTQVISWDTDE